MLPYLGHHAPPDPSRASDATRQLLELPRLREVEMEPRSAGFFQATTVDDISAMALYLTGVESPFPCFRCLCNKGPFRGCVIVHPDAPISARALFKTCANCVYKGHGEQCGLNAFTLNGQREPSAASLPRPEVGRARDATPVPGERVTEAGEMQRPPARGSLDGHDEDTGLMTENFSDLAVGCFSDMVENDEDHGPALLPAAEVLPMPPQTPVATSSTDAVDPASNPVEDVSESPPAAAHQPAEAVALVTPERRSPRFAMKKSAITPKPTTPLAPRTRGQSGSSPRMTRSRSAALQGDGGGDVSGMD